MLAAINQLNTDLQNPNASFSTLQSDVVNYYQVQTGARGYAGLAASVAGESDYNGTVAVQNLENFFGDSSYGMKELNVAIQLAKQDWNNITNNGSINVGGGQTVYVPDIVDDSVDHSQVFSKLGIPFSVWSGLDFAENNLNWMGSAALPADLQGLSSQSASLPPMSAGQQANALGNLTLAAFESDFETLPTPTYLSERLGDDYTFASLLGSYMESGAKSVISAIQTYGISFGMTGSDTGSVIINPTTLDQKLGTTALSNYQVGSVSEVLNGGDLTMQTIEYNNGTSTVRIPDLNASTELEVQNYSSANGTGTDEENILFGNNGSSTIDAFSNLSPIDTSGSVINFENSGLNETVVGTGNIVNGSNNSDLTTTGGGVTVNLGSSLGFTFSGSGATLDLSGANQLSASGTNNSIVDNVGGSTVSLGAGSSDYFAGRNDNFVLDNNIQFTDINASGVTVRLDPNCTDGIHCAGNTVDLSNNDNLTDDGDTVNVAANQTDTVAGYSDALVASTGDTLTVSDSGGTGIDTVGLAGGDTLDASTAGVTANLAAGTSDTFNGVSGDIANLLNGDTLNTGAGGITTDLEFGAGATIVGGGDTVNLSASDYLALLGSSDTIIGTATTTGTINGTQVIGSFENLIENGSRDTSTLGAWSSSTLNGTLDTTSVGAFSSVYDNGTNNVLDGSVNTDTLIAGLTATINGNNDTIIGTATTTGTINGTPVTGSFENLTENGSGDTSTLGAWSGTTLNGTFDTTTVGAYSSVYDNGTNNVLDGSVNTDTLIAGLTATINGNNDTIIGTATTTGTINGTPVTGSFENLTENGSGDTSTLGAWSGTTLNGTFDTTTVGAFSSVFDNGNNNVLDGSVDTDRLIAGLTTTINGNSDTIIGTATTTGTINGTPVTGSFENLTEDGSGDTSTLGAWSDSTLNGTLDTTTVGAFSSVFDNGNNNVLDGSVDTETLIAGLTATVNGTSDTFNTGSGDVLNLGSANSVDTFNNGGATINAKLGSDNLTGSGDTVAFSSSNGILNVNGSSDNVTDSAAGDTVFLGSGVGDRFSGLSTDVLALSASTGVTVTSSGGTIDLNGNGDNLNDTSSGATINLFASGDGVTASSDTIYVGAGGTDSFTGSHDSLTDGYTGTAFINGTGNSFSGLSTDVVALSANTGVTVTSSGGTIDLNGSGDNLNDTSSGATINLFASGEGVTASGDTVYVGSAGQDSFTGSNDSGSLTGGVALSAIGTGNSFTINNGDVVTLGGDTNGTDALYLANANTNATGIFNGLDGSSQEQIYNPNNSTATQILDYSSPNDMGTLQDQSWLYDNGTSASDLYNANVSGGVQEADLSYDTPDAIFGTTTALANDYYKALLDLTSAAGGGSQVQLYDNTGSSLPQGTTLEYTDYASVGGGGAMLDTTSDFTNNTSITTDFNPEAGVGSVTGTFSGLDDSGNLENIRFGYDANGYNLTFDDRFTYSGNTQEDVYQSVYNASGQRTGYAEFNAQTDALVQNFQGNYGYAGSGFSYSYAYGFGYGSGNAVTGGSNIAAIGGHGRLSKGGVSGAHGDPSTRGKHRLTASAGSIADLIASARQTSGAGGATSNAVAAPDTGSAALNNLVQAMASLPSQSLMETAPEPWKRLETSSPVLAAAN